MATLTAVNAEPHAGQMQPHFAPARSGPNSWMYRAKPVSASVAHAMTSSLSCLDAVAGLPNCSRVCDSWDISDQRYLNSLPFRTDYLGRWLGITKLRLLSVEAVTCRLPAARDGPNLLSRSPDRSSRRHACRYPLLARRIDGRSLGAGWRSGSRGPPPGGCWMG